jgi:hypothetical protein
MPMSKPTLKQVAASQISLKQEMLQRTKKSSSKVAAEVAAGLALVVLLLAPLRMTAQANSSASGPALVELFTSEGCSSCPPADALLEQVSREMPEIILLSEHVTYWNHLGWTDPFSSDIATERQEVYAGRFRKEGPYTPQMVVNGIYEFVGSDRGSLRSALKQDAANHAANPAPHLTVSRLAPEKSHTLRAAVHLDASAAAGRMMAVLVQDHGHAQVSRGENSGRTLTHVDIAREFYEMGPVHSGAAFGGEVSFNLPAAAEAAGFHVVVFLQKEAGGAILAAGSSKGS